MAGASPPRYSCIASCPSATDTIPNFEITFYPGREPPDGRASIELTELIGGGRPVILNFFFGGCPDCATMMARLQEVHRVHAGEILVVGVDVTTLSTGTPQDGGRVLLSVMGVTYPVGTTGDENVAGANGAVVSPVPDTFFIGGEGELVGRYAGSMDGAAFDSSVSSLLPPAEPLPSSFPEEGPPVVEPAAPVAVVEPVDSIPEFTMCAYQGEEVLGGTSGIAFSSLIGRATPLILNFYYSPCGPCHAAMTFLQEFYEQNRGEVLVVGVDITHLVGGLSPEDGETILEELGVTYPVGATNDSLIIGVPTTFFISGEGRLVGGKMGWWSDAVDQEPSEKQLQEEVNSLISEMVSPPTE